MSDMTYTPEQMRDAGLHLEAYGSPSSQEQRDVWIAMLRQGADAVKQNAKLLAIIKRMMPFLSDELEYDEQIVTDLQADIAAFTETKP